MQNRDALVQTLTRVATDCQRDHGTAVGDGRWRDALQSLLTSLIWRTISLALRLNIATPQFDPRTDPVALARRLRADCVEALGALVSTEDNADDFHKVQTINEVLDGILDIVGVAEAWTGVDPEEPFFLAFAATRLGQAEIGLGFAESNFWGQVAAWRSQKRAGRQVGYRFEWRKEAAKEIRKWLTNDPKMSRTELIVRFAEWLDERRATHRDFKGPAFDNIAKTLSAMNKQGLISLP